MCMRAIQHLIVIQLILLPWHQIYRWNIREIMLKIHTANWGNEEEEKKNGAHTGRVWDNHLGFKVHKNTPNSWFPSSFFLFVCWVDHSLNLCIYWLLFDVVSCLFNPNIYSLLLFFLVGFISLCVFVVYDKR